MEAALRTQLLQIGDLIRLAPADDYFAGTYGGCWQVLSMRPDKVELRRVDVRGEPVEESPRRVNLEIDLLNLWFQTEIAWPLIKGELLRGERESGGVRMRWLLLDATAFADERAVWQVIPWRPGYTGPGLMFAEVPFIAAADARRILVKQVISRAVPAELRLVA